MTARNVLKVCKQLIKFNYFNQIVLLLCTLSPGMRSLRGWLNFKRMMGRIRDIGEVLIFLVSRLILRSPLTLTSHLPPPTVTGCHEAPVKLRGCGVSTSWARSHLLNIIGINLISDSVHCLVIIHFSITCEITYKFKFLLVDKNNIINLKF